LTELLGREYSVYRGAVRTYRVGFDPEEDQPSDHPVCRAERIRDWPDRGPVSFAGLLIAEAARETVARTDLERDLPSFWRVRQIWLQAEQRKAHDQDETDAAELEIANQRLRELQTQLEEQKSTYDDLLHEADQEFKSLEAERSELNEQNRALRSRAEHLQAALQFRPGPLMGLPESFEEIDSGPP
jgi:hypothetical protein